MSPGEPRLPTPLIQRDLCLRSPTLAASATVLLGVRRCGKSTLLAQWMARCEHALYLNFEDPRLFGLGPEDFPPLLDLCRQGEAASVFLDEVQEVPEWQRFVRALLDAGRAVCLTGSNASLLGRELGSKLTGRHLSLEVFPFSFTEYRKYCGRPADAAALQGYLDDGGFPSYLRERDPRILQELLRDIVSRDIAQRYRLRETRHVMSLLLFLLANTGQPFSLQRLTKSLAIPTVGQTSRYLEFLQDAFLLLSVPKYSASVRQRVTAPAKYYAIDNGLRRVNTPAGGAPDLGHRLENSVLLELRRCGEHPAYAAERDVWECDFVTDTAAIQVCARLTPENLARELRGLVAACRLPGTRQALILTLDQRDRLEADGVFVLVRPAWEWMEERAVGR